MSALYLVRTPSELVAIARAVNVLVGLSAPVRGAVVGGPDTLPTEYQGMGTPGWTDAASRGSWVAADLSLAAAPVPAGMEQFSGLTVELDGAPYTLPLLEEAVTEEQLPYALTPEGGAFWWAGHVDENGAPIP